MQVITDGETTTICFVIWGGGSYVLLSLNWSLFPDWYRWRHPTACIVVATALTQLQQTSTTAPPTTTIPPTTTAPSTTTPPKTIAPPWIVPPTTTTTTAWVEPSPQQGHNKQSPSRFPITPVQVSFTFLISLDKLQFQGWNRCWNKASTTLQTNNYNKSMNTTKHLIKLSWQRKRPKRWQWGLKTCPDYPDHRHHHQSYWHHHSRHQHNLYQGGAEGEQEPAPTPTTFCCRSKRWGGEGRGGDQTFGKNILWLLEYIVTSQARLDISKTWQLDLQALHAEEVRLVSLPGRQTAELVQVVIMMMMMMMMVMVIMMITTTKRG